MADSENTRTAPEGTAKIARRRLLPGLAAAPAVALVPAALAPPTFAAVTPAPAVGDDTAIVAAFQRWIDAQNEYERASAEGASDRELSLIDAQGIGGMFEAVDTPATSMIGLALQVHLTVFAVRGAGPDQHVAAIRPLDEDDAGDLQNRTTRGLFESVCSIFPGLRDLADAHWDEVAKFDLARRIAA